MKSLEARGRGVLAWEVVDVEMICAAVANAFVATGAGTTPWPDPHPDRQPADDEYSRCLDPAKYRIVAARAEAWLETLGDLGLARVAPVEDLTSAWRDGPARGSVTTRAQWLVPRRADAITVLVCFDSFEGVADNGVALGTGAPAVEIARIPACGCDACDSGSDDLLAELDDHLLDVVSGQFVHVTTPDGVAQGRRNGWSATGFGGRRGRGRIEQELADARAGCSRHPVVSGVPWW